MKRIFLIIGLLSALSISCKNDATQKKVEYPAFWKENNVPEFKDGLITKTSIKQENLKVNHTVFVESSADFDQIHQWHLNELKANGWKNVKNLRKNIGQDDELIIIVHTNGKMKHSTTVLKKDEGVREIKTILSKFGG